MPNDFILVLMTAGNKTEAEQISHALLERKLIACANIVGPVSSHYRWNGKIEAAEEYLALMKSRTDLFSELSAAIKLLHSYEVPEIIALPMSAGSEAYFAWLANSLK
jgi:periplasmic divalent cation tolerance protein